MNAQIFPAPAVSGDECLAARHPGEEKQRQAVTTKGRKPGVADKVVETASAIGAAPVVAGTSAFSDAIGAEAHRLQSSGIAVRRCGSEVGKAHATRAALAHRVRSALVRVALFFERHPTAWTNGTVWGGRDESGCPCHPWPRAVQWDLYGRLSRELGAGPGMQLADETAEQHAALWVDELDGDELPLADINDRGCSSALDAARVARWLAMFVGVGLAREYEPEVGAPTLLGQMRQFRPSSYGPREAVAL